jgi:hypothetical protein
MEELIDMLEDVGEEDYYNRIPRTRGPTKIRDRINHFDKWDGMEFFERFRMSKDTAHLVLNLIEESLRSKTNKNRAVTPEQKFLCALRFYASDNFLINVGELSGLSKSSTSKIVKQVSFAIARLCPQFIAMPRTQQEINSVKSGFFSLARFPHCVGAIDCTHVKIQSLGGDDAEIFRNRKGFFSINVQAVCDSSLLFRNIVARWPGSSHDAHIFNSSQIKRDMQNNMFDNGVLVGDNGYSCTNYLIPPLDNVSTQEEQLFQEAQIRTRNPIERAFGVWKRRFPVLSMGIRLRQDRIESVIVATAILNNICTQANEDVPPVTPELEAAIAAMEMPPPQQGPRRNARNPIEDPNTVTRYNLINRYFRSLL